MLKLKDYNWVLDGLAALVLLVGFVTMFIVGNETISELVIRVVGLAILFFTAMRIKPIIAFRNEKDYLLIMFTEMLINLIVGVIMLFFATFVATSDIFTFSRLTGIVLYIRGICHFYTTSKRYELHDIIGFIVHILFISFGFLFLFSNAIEDKFVVAIYLLTILLSGYFGYRSFKGYRNFRVLKENQLKVNNYVDDKKHKEEVVEDPKHIEEKRNPKIIEEPQNIQDPIIEDKDEDRPSIDVN